MRKEHYEKCVHIKCQHFQAGDDVGQVKVNKLGQVVNKLRLTGI